VGTYESEDAFWMWLIMVWLNIWFNFPAIRSVCETIIVDPRKNGHGGDDEEKADENW
jgi:hypothetical protein